MDVLLINKYLHYFKGTCKALIQHCERIIRKKYYSWVFFNDWTIKNIQVHCIYKYKDTKDVAVNHKDKQ